MGPINCAPNPIREKVKKTKIFVNSHFSMNSDEISHTDQESK